MANINASQLRQEFTRTRELSMTLTSAFTPEDQMLQSMPEASPTKWHLAHTTWFFDTFILKPRNKQQCFDKNFEFLFNSYYNGVGPQFRRAHRRLISRPSLADIWRYREYLEEKLNKIFDELEPWELELVNLGINHEQQHQELIVTDIKHALSFNPQYPAITSAPANTAAAPALSFCSYPAGEYSIGCHDADAFDNESPVHKIYLNAFRIANRPVTNYEYLQFINDGGYQNASHWLSDGWLWVTENNVSSPLYWKKIDGRWFSYTLAGLRQIDVHEPVCHINFYEASAFAHWTGKRLPTEFEWEVAASQTDISGNFLDVALLHPQSAPSATAQRPLQIFGDVWEWTQSAYLPYPGFHPKAGAIGEYNGKFMVNQWVLRGGSCATPRGHIRSTYRNFFPVNASWQFSGVRLADDLG